MLISYNSCINDFESVVIHSVNFAQLVHDTNSWLTTIPQNYTNGTRVLMKRVRLLTSLPTDHDGGVSATELKAYTRHYRIAYVRNAVVHRGSRRTRRVETNIGTCVLRLWIMNRLYLQLVESTDIILNIDVGPIISISCCDVENYTISVSHQKKKKNFVSYKYRYRYLLFH